MTGSQGNPSAVPLPGPLVDPTSPRLTLVTGSAATVDVYLRDEQSQPEDMTGVTGAMFTLKDSVTDTVTLIQKSTVAGTITVDPINSKITIQFTGNDTVQLNSGVYVADIALEVGSLWYLTDPFQVSIVQSVTLVPQ